jgi:hypothetical protein
MSSDDHSREDAVDLKMAAQYKAYMDELGQKLPTVESMEKFTPADEDGLPVAQIWSNFLQDKWEHKFRVLQKAGYTDKELALGLGIKLHREEKLVLILNYGNGRASATFNPRNKQDTEDEILRKCALYENIPLVSQVGSEAEERMNKIRFDVEPQLTQIYQEYYQKENADAAKDRSGLRPYVVPYYRLDDLACESIHVKRQPAFLCYDHKSHRFYIASEIQLPDKKLTLKPVSDISYEPYDFTEKEVQELDVAKVLTDDQAYEVILRTITPYQFADNQHLRIDSAGILLSYHQDRVVSVPYITKLGPPESGKSRSLCVICWLVYRPLYAIDMTAANVYRFYGSDQSLQGVGTIIHDEIDDAKIDNDASLRAIYNAGNVYGAKVPRITGEHQEKQSYYNCYGEKFYAGVKMPLNKPFRSRNLIQTSIQGEPEKIDITEEDEAIFRSVRKMLLVQRLVRAFDGRFLPIKNLPLKLRSRQLYMPLLQVIQGTRWYDELLQPLLEFDRQRREEDQESKQGYVARAVISCWLDAANEAIFNGKAAAVDDKSRITRPDDLRLDGNITKPLFVTNEDVIAKMGLDESSNKQGRKVLESNEIPFTFTRQDIGRIQAENLRGKTKVERLGGKLHRVHLFDLKTIRAHYRRYHIPDPDDGNGKSNDDDNDKGNDGSSPTVTPVTPVTANSKGVGDYNNINDAESINEEGNEENLGKSIEGIGNSLLQNDIQDPTHDLQGVTAVTAITRPSLYEFWRAYCLIPSPKTHEKNSVKKNPANVLFQCQCPLCDFKFGNQDPDAAIYAVSVVHAFREHPGEKIGEILWERGYVTPSSVNCNNQGE